MSLVKSKNGMKHKGALNLKTKEELLWSDQIQGRKLNCAGAFLALQQIFSAQNIRSLHSFPILIPTFMFITL